jgi:hypothetical protein
MEQTDSSDNAFELFETHSDLNEVFRGFFLSAGKSKNRLGTLHSHPSQLYMNNRNKLSYW